MTALPVIRLKHREGRRVRSGALWVFANEIVMDGAAKALAKGSLVHLAAASGAPLGVGYFNPRSLIALRLLGPPGVEIGREFFAQKIRAAETLRRRLFDAPYYRLVHAEGDGLPGLVADRFAESLVVQMTTAGIDRLAEDVLAAFEDVLTPANIVLRNDSPVRAIEGLDSYVRAAKGMAGRIGLEENGAQYLADLAAGQKSGWYYDQRENRAFMSRFANGARVLDAYCYTGGFGILAAKAGAREVTFLDSSDGALAAARETAEKNGVAERCRFVRSDAFAELERRTAQTESFDVVTCDPPPFIRARKDLEPGAKAYRKLARLAAGVTAPGGVLFLASCSHNISRERFALECAAGIFRAGRQGRLIRDAGAGPDHPVHPLLPETAYLKGLVYALD